MGHTELVDRNCLSGGSDSVVEKKWQFGYCGNWETGIGYLWISPDLSRYAVMTISNDLGFFKNELSV
jgi:hypothetical protein